MSGEPPRIGPFDGEEEQLPGRSPRSPRTLRIDLMVGSGLLIAVLLVGSAISERQRDADPSITSRPSRAAPTYAPTPPALPAPSSLLLTRGNGSLVLVPALPRRTDPDPTRCPAGTSCFEQDAVPGRVLDAVQQVFPQAELVSSRSVRLMTDPWAGDVWFRQLDLRVSGAALTIRVTAPGPLDDAGSGTTGTGFVFYTTTVQQYVVAAQVGPGAGGDVDKLRRIASDERLLAA